MPRVVWKILGAAGALVVLVAVGVAIAIATVDPARFVAPLAARVKAATGRDLKVGGPVEITYSLQPRVVLHGVSFANAPWAKTPAMLTANRVEAEIALLPLLSRRFEAVEFSLVDPVIALETDAQGRGNWEFASAAQSATGAAPGAPSSATSTIGIGNFEIRNGNLTYRNGASGQVTSASIERMSLRARDLASPIAVDFRGAVAGVPIAMSGDLGAANLWLSERAPYPVAMKGEVAGRAVRIDTKVARDASSTTLGDLSLAYGNVKGTGSVRIVETAGKKRYVVDFHVPSLAVADLSAIGSGGAGPGSGKAATPPPAQPSRFVIPDTPLPPMPLIGTDSEGSIVVDDLVLRDGAHLRRVDAKFTSNASGADATFGIGEAFGGSLRGQLRVDGDAKAPRVRLSLAANDLDLPAIASRAGIAREIHGGRVRANVDIDGRGASPHAIASTMSGSILAVSGPASLGRGNGHGEDALAQLVGALDPLQGADAATQLHCAVFRLPLANGVARVDRSIAVETDKLSASASGTVNFRDETLDLSVHPQLHTGIKLDVSQLASLVRVRGPFEKPSVGIDAANAAKTIAEIGALGASGAGLAAIGRALIAPTAEREDVCAIALGQRTPTPEPARGQERSPRPRAQPAPSPALPGDLGKALGKLFGR
jgi:uncharacterized protein involved in outer membrane biogenesis